MVDEPEVPSCMVCDDRVALDDRSTTVSEDRTFLAAETSCCADSGEPVGSVLGASGSPKTGGAGIKVVRGFDGVKVCCDVPKEPEL